MADTDNNRESETLHTGTGNATGDSASSSHHQRGRNNPDKDGTDEAALRSSAQAYDFAGDAQNVNADNSRPLQGDDVQHARNKANENKGAKDSR